MAIMSTAAKRRIWMNPFALKQQHPIIQAKISRASIAERMFEIILFEFLAYDFHCWQTFI